VSTSLRHSSEGSLLIAGLSTFGYGGTIVHALIEQVSLSMSRDLSRWRTAASSLVSSLQVVSGGGVVCQFHGQGVIRIGVCRHFVESVASLLLSLGRCDAVWRPILGGGAFDSLYPDLSHASSAVEAEGRL
jgi:hypothetical protein